MEIIWRWSRTYQLSGIGPKFYNCVKTTIWGQCHSWNTSGSICSLGIAVARITNYLNRGRVLLHFLIPKYTSLEYMHIICYKECWTSDLVSFPDSFSPHGKLDFSLCGEKWSGNKTISQIQLLTVLSAFYKIPETQWLLWYFCFLCFCKGWSLIPAQNSWSSINLCWSSLKWYACDLWPLLHSRKSLNVYEQAKGASWANRLNSVCPTKWSLLNM